LPLSTQARKAPCPIYDALIAAVYSLETISISHRKNLRQPEAQQAVCYRPAFNKGADRSGLNLKGIAPAGRLEASGSFNPMVSHRVRIGSLDQVDRELIGWLRTAYEAA
jgi:hypothetical protein